MIELDWPDGDFPDSIGWSAWFRWSDSWRLCFWPLGRPHPLKCRPPLGDVNQGVGYDLPFVRRGHHATKWPILWPDVQVRGRGVVPKDDKSKTGCLWLTKSFIWQLVCSINFGLLRQNQSFHLRATGKYITQEVIYWATRSVAGGGRKGRMGKWLPNFKGTFPCFTRKCH